MSEKHYDVIIIGGRCAGASLAIRLAGHNLKILLVDRATFPSMPNVPSSPFIHPATMRLLDELNIPETEYAHEGSKIEHFILADFETDFLASMPTGAMGLDRNYFRGVDRRLFDATLWKHASQVAGVLAREGFSVTEILKDESGIVCGIAGKSEGGESEAFTADLVIGADGRYSFSARQFGAKVIEEQNDFLSAAYFAEWANAEHHMPEYPNAITTYNSFNGLMILVSPLADRRYNVATVMKSADANFGAQGFEQTYLEKIQSIPHLWNRLKNAERVSDVIGMRRIENGYREAYGARWALVGDAVHYKDPSDGQGIYDALLESKLLAQAIINWKRNGDLWQDAGAKYQQEMLEATRPMFLHTVANVKQSLYMNAPVAVVRKLIPLMTNHSNFATDFLLYLARAIEPQDFKPFSSKVLFTAISGAIRSRFKQ